MEPIDLLHHVPAPPPEVFEWLTKPERIVQWSGPDAQFEARVGGGYSMFEDWVMGTVRAIEPPRLLEYTWAPADWDLDAPESVVRYELDEGPNGCTTVHLTHTGFPNQEQRDAHAKSWVEHVFEPLCEVITSLKTAPR